jgi:hypothetical protein
MTSVTAGGPGLVVVGWDASSSDQVAAVWTSVDGVTWSRVPHDEKVFGGEGDQTMGSVTVGGPGLVAVGRDLSDDLVAAVWTSVDGVTWSRVPDDENVLGGVMKSVTAAGPGLVAVGSAGSGGLPDAVVWTSPDGVTWSRVPDDELALGGSGGQTMESVTVGGPGLVAVGSDASSSSDQDAAVWTSIDGVTWSRVPHDETVLGGEGFQSMLSVTVGGPGLVAVGGDGSDDFDAAVWVAATED